MHENIPGAAFHFCWLAEPDIWFPYSTQNINFIYIAKSELLDSDFSGESTGLKNIFPVSQDTSFKE